VSSKEERDRDRANMEKLREQQRQAQQDRLNAAAAEEATLQRMNKAADDEFMSGIADLMGGAGLEGMGDLKWMEDETARKHLEDMRRVAKKDPSKAEKIYQKNRKKINKAVNEAGEKKKKAKGCGVVGLLLMGAGAAALAATAYGAHEVLGALIK
jgi:hypothetical protein